MAFATLPLLAPDAAPATARESELLQLLQAMGCGLWEWHVPSHRLRFEGEFFRRFGVYEQPPERCLSYWASLRHPAERDQVAAQVQQVHSGQVQQFRWEFRVRDLSGQWRWLLTHGCIMERDAQQRPVRIQGITQDVTHRYNALEAARNATPLAEMDEDQRQHNELRIFSSLMQQAGRLARLGAWEDAPGRGIVYWSDICYTIHGLPPSSPLPRNYLQTFVAPPWREEMRSKMRECLRRGTEWSIVMQIQRADDGRLVWVRARGEPVVENGRIARIRGVMQDIDDSKHAEEQLRQSEEHFARIFQLVDQPMGIVRRSDEQHLIVNPAWETLTGYSAAQALGRTAIELGLITKADHQGMFAAPQADSSLSDHEITMTRCDGEQRSIVQSLRAVDYYNEPCWLFSCNDITEHKRREYSIREREELLSLTMAAAALGRWDWDLQTGQAKADAQWHAMHGAAHPKEAMQHITHWSEQLSAEDQARIEAALAVHRDHPHQPFDITLRIAQPSNAPPRWVRSLGKIVSTSADGQPLRMMGVSMDVTQQRTQQEQLHRLAHFDPLTSLPNRVQLAHRLQQAMEQARSGTTLLGVAYLDLDGFKPINDRLGHSAGDRLLVNLAARLNNALGPANCLARLGGDEFVILLPGLRSRADCETQLRQLMQHIAAPYALENERVHITASIGYTLFPEDDADADALLRHADQAMYQAKQAGRNRFHGFDTALARSQYEQHQQSERLGQALERGEFTLYLQPKVDMQNGAVVGAECLLRWQHPEQGLLGPGDFLPALAGTELEIRLGQWVLRHALQCIAQLQSEGLELPLAVNIAAQHLQQSDFAPWVQRCLQEQPGVPSALLELEITESAALYDIDHVAHQLSQLRTLGIGIALDDFGTGYSSLTYLRRLPLDTIKIDQSFVRDMLQDQGDLAIVQGVIGLAHSFGHHIVAEGVETLEQGQKLQQLGCSLAQGYYIARPMPVSDFAAWVAHWQLPTGWQQNRLF